MGRKGGESTSRCLRDSYGDTNERYYVIYRGSNRKRHNGGSVGGGGCLGELCRVPWLGAGGKKRFPVVECRGSRLEEQVSESLLVFVDVLP